MFIFIIMFTLWFFHEGKILIRKLIANLPLFILIISVPIHKSTEDGG